jgi:site-specific recombinase XerD
MDKITQSFYSYLENLGVSKFTFKNYKSDLNHFVKWMTKKVSSLGASANNLTEVVPFISEKTIKQYKNYLQRESLSTKTVNRRLATMRHLGMFLVKAQILEFNFTKEVENVGTSKKEPSPSYEAIISSFEKQLKEEKVSKNTLKNYISDVKQFLRWAEHNSTLN